MKVGKMISKITFIFCIKSVEWITKNYADFYFINEQILVIHSFIYFMNIDGVIKLKTPYQKKKIHQFV